MSLWYRGDKGSFQFVPHYAETREPLGRPMHKIPICAACPSCSAGNFVPKKRPVWTCYCNPAVTLYTFTQVFYRGKWTNDGEITEDTCKLTRIAMIAVNYVFFAAEFRRHRSRINFWPLLVEIKKNRPKTGRCGWPSHNRGLIRGPRTWGTAVDLMESGGGP